MVKDLPKSAIYASETDNDLAPLRVGLMSERLGVPAWAYAAVAEIAASKFARLAVVIVVQPDARNAASGADADSQHARRSESFAYRIYRAVDRLRHPDLARATGDANLANVLGATEIIYVDAVSDGDRFELDEDQIASIVQYDLDAILYLGSQRPCGRVLSSSRFGIWSYRHGCNGSGCDPSAYFWEMHDKSHACETSLQKLDDSAGGGEIIFRSFGAVDSDISLLKAGFRNYSKSSAFVLRCLRHVRAGVPLGAGAGNQDVSAGRRHRSPTNLEMLAFLGRGIGAAIGTRINSALKKEQWFIAFRKAEEPRRAVPSTHDFVPLIPPLSSYYADPFPITVGGKDYIFFEEVRESKQIGHISYVALDHSGRPGEPGVALSSDYHLSYPFLFKHDGEIYLVPESSGAKSVDAYRAVQFPDEWVYHATLLSGVKAVDSTLLCHHGVWYLFTTISECGGASGDELFLFMSSSPLGPWSPHPGNPIKSDARSARGAGRIFEVDGRLIRPAQDCTGTYGRAIRLCEIVVLSETHYEERIIGEIGPEWTEGLIGTHTYNASDTLEVIDGKRMVWRW